eukprot:jgi/Chlat1/443/Chrsp103S08587
MEKDKEVTENDEKDEHGDGRRGEVVCMLSVEKISKHVDRRKRKEQAREKDKRRRRRRRRKDRSSVSSSSPSSLSSSSATSSSSSSSGEDSESSEDQRQKRKRRSSREPTKRKRSRRNHKDKHATKKRQAFYCAGSPIVKRSRRRDVGEVSGDGSDKAEDVAGGDAIGALDPSAALVVSRQAAAYADVNRMNEHTRQAAAFAQARLASGELQQARQHQKQMQNMYGTTDRRASKKLAQETRKLKKVVSVCKQLEEHEQRELERMDAFRAALGLPSAEAQRQAEWRAAMSAAAAAAADSPRVQSGGETRAKRIGPKVPSSLK